VKIGVIYPLTGDASAWGAEARNGVELAVDDFEPQDKLRGVSIRPIIEDSKSAPKDAVSAANKLIFQDKVKFIVGDLASSNLLAIAPICEENHVLTIGQGSNPKIRDAGDYIFRTWPSDDLQGKALAKFLNKELQPKAVAILFVNNEYGRGVVDVVKGELVAPLTLEESYASGTRDFRNIIQKIPATSEALLLVAYPEELPALLRQLAEAGVKIPIIGTETFENEEIKKLHLSLRLYYTVPKVADPSSAAYQQFADNYRTKYGKDPGVPADAVFDAMLLILRAIDRVGSDVEKVKAELYATKNYEGSSGTIIFDNYGDVLKGFQIKLLQNGQLSVAGDLTL
jgi:branched-chain amino acid transport system substrate-binding protein